MSPAYYYIHISRTTTTKVFISFNVKNACGHDIIILGSHSVDVNPNLCIFQRNWAPFSTNVSINTPFCQNLYQKFMLSTLQTLLSAHILEFP
jgi:hypothetical protein